MEGTFGSLKEKLKENNEFFFTGIGGQGVVTGSNLFLEGLSDSKWELAGVYSPGAERRGKPISCFIGLYSDSRKLKSYELLVEKDILVVFDPASVGKEQLLNGLREDGIVLFNTSKRPEELVKENGKLEYFNVATVDASGIFSDVFTDLFGRAPTFEEIRPNVPTIAALFNITGLASLATFIKVVTNKWGWGRIGDINKQAAIAAYNKALVMKSSKKGMDTAITEMERTPVDELTEIALCFPTEGVGGHTGLWALIQPQIKIELCNNCGTCFYFCPDNCVIWKKGDDAPKIDLRYCKGCGICAEECKQEAIEMVEVKR